MKPEFKFTKRMQALFGAPDASNVEDVIAEYVNALKGVEAAVLDRAADKIARTRRIRAWPTVAECLDAVREAEANPNDIGLRVISNFDKWWAERLAKIDTATTESDIHDQLEIVRPYYEAKWIPSRHWNEAVSHAEQRRKTWKSEQAAKVALRTIGEGAE